MPADLSELSSIASTLEQLSVRMARMGETANAAKEEDLAAELFAVERALSGAQRRLSRLVVRGAR